MRSLVREACLILVVGTPLFSAAASALSQDWPQWRGPNRDGAVQGVSVPKKWPKALKEEWKVAVGEGYSSPVVVGGKVYVFTRQKEDEPRQNEIARFPIGSC